MNRKASSLTSLGISMALIAIAIYFLMYLYDRHHGWMMISGGNGIEIIVLIFWVALIGAAVLLTLGAVSTIISRR